MSTQEQARLAYEVALARRLTRHRFLRKVYALLAAQLLLVVLLACQLAHIKPLRKFLQGAPWAAALPTVLLALVIIILACSTAARIASPVNVVNLGVLTVVLGLQLAAVSAAWATKTLVLGTLLTAATLLVLSLQSLQLSSDASFANSCMWVAGALLVLGPIAHQQLQIAAVRCLIAGCGALSLAACVVYDAHLMADGNHVHQQQQLGAGVFAVLNMYTDPITLLLVLLSRRQQQQCAARMPLLHC
jgi:FtsH-binding integral membrane protein